MHRFTFNLLPEKPKEEIIKEETRESTSLTLAFLPFITVLISIVLIFLNNVVFQGQINTWEAAIKGRENKIREYEQIITLNIEYSQKTGLLEEPVTLDVEPEKFFDLTQNIIAGLPFTAQVSKYGKNPDGSFDITLSSNEISNAAEIIRIFELNNNIGSVNLKSLNVDLEGGIIDTTVNFFLVDEVITAENGS